MKKKKFWEFRNAANGAGSELTIYGDVSDVCWWGDEVTPKQFKQDLDAAGDGELSIYINSGGGDVFAGQAIYSMLKRHNAKKTVYIDGLAASIASVIAMTGDRIVMPKNAMMMIHNSWTMVGGGKERLRKIADEMDKIDGIICGVYADRSGRTAEEIAAWMDAETWFAAEEAVAAGLADEIKESKQIAAHVEGEFLTLGNQRFCLSRYKNAPRITDVPDGGGIGRPAADKDPPEGDGQKEPKGGAESPEMLMQRRRFFAAEQKIIDAYGRE